MSCLVTEAPYSISVLQTVLRLYKAAMCRAVWPYSFSTRSITHDGTKIYQNLTTFDYGDFHLSNVPDFLKTNQSNDYEGCSVNRRNSVTIFVSLHSWTPSSVFSHIPTKTFTKRFLNILCLIPANHISSFVGNMLRKEQLRRK